MADQILNNLIAAVNNLRDNAEGNNTNPSVSQRQQAAATSESTSQALRRLYPSIDWFSRNIPRLKQSWDNFKLIKIHKLMHN